MFHPINTKDWTYTQGLLEEPVPESALGPFREGSDNSAGDFTNPIRSEYTEGLVYYDRGQFVYLLSPQQTTLTDFNESQITHITPTIIVTGETIGNTEVDLTTLRFAWLQDGATYPLPYSNMFAPNQVRLRNNEVITNTAATCWGGSYIPEDQCTLSQIGNLTRNLFTGKPNDDLDNPVAEAFEIWSNPDLENTDHHQRLIDIFRVLAPSRVTEETVEEKVHNLYIDYLMFSQELEDDVSVGEITPGHNDKGYTYRRLDHLYHTLGSVLDKTDDETEQFRIASRFWQRIARVAKDLGEATDSQATCLSIRA